MLMRFEIKDGWVNGKSLFCFELENENMLKMLANSHPRIDKVVRGALCKQFVRKLSLYLGREVTLEEANEICKRAK